MTDYPSGYVHTVDTYCQRPRLCGCRPNPHCHYCGKPLEEDAPQIETVGAGSAYNDSCSHAVNSDCPHYS